MSRVRSSTCKNSKPSVETLDREINLLIQSSMAPRTWKTYHAAVESLNQFRQLYNIHNVWPVPVNDLMQFIAFLSYSGRSPSTITTYIAGLSHTHKINGIEDHAKSFLVCKLLESLRRKNPKKSDLRVLISLSRLKRLICTLPHVCSSVYEARRFSTAFALACFDLLRVDEFTSDSKSISGTHVLCFNDISFHKINNKEELYVKVCSSKTDQRHSSTTLAICELKMIKLFVLYV